MGPYFNGRIDALGASDLGSIPNGPLLFSYSNFLFWQPRKQHNYGLVAQSVEHQAVNLSVNGSIPFETALLI